MSVNALGRLILAEFKLWRNPQARREVIGQILFSANSVRSTLSNGRGW